MATPLEQFEAGLQAAGCKRHGRDAWQCPAHDDGRASLSVKEGDDGRVLVHCHAGCTPESIVKTVGMRMGDLFPNPSGPRARQKPKTVAIYSYHDEQGSELFQVVRFEPKDFRQRRRDGVGGWTWTLGETRRVLYKLPEVLAAVAEGGTIYITEGEKDANAINDLPDAGNVIGTTNAGGAGKWRPEYTEALRGATVVIVADKDEPGRKHARQVAERLRGVAASVQVVEARTGKDAADHLAAGLGLEDFVPMDPGITQDPDPGGNGIPQECETPPRSSQADRLVELAHQEAVELFRDGTGEAWARIPVRDHRQIIRCRSRAFRRWLAGRFWAAEGKAVHSEALSSALNVLEAQALNDGQQHDLHNRVAEHEGAIWYDLGDERWRAVRVTPQGWQVVSHPPILFRRYSHQRPQVDPVDGGDLHRLLDFVNLRDRDQQLLLLVHVVSCLVPGIPHPVTVLHGGQGAAKTTLFRVERRLVDPSITETLTIAHDVPQLVQQLSHHLMPLFDNLTTVPDWVSDALCRAVTGEGFSKRELYSDDEDVIYSFRRCCGLNGINVAAHKPDLLDRCILFRLEPIPATKRRPEAELWREFEAIRPRLFGAALDALSRAMAQLPSVRLPGLPRMADFALWGCAIAQGLGHSQDEFLAAFGRSLRTRNDEVLANHPVAAMVVALMEGSVAWEGSPSDLLGELEKLAQQSRIDTRAKTWPKAPHALTRRLNEIQHNLLAVGILVTTGGTNRVVTISSVAGESVDGADTVKEGVGSCGRGGAFGDAPSGRGKTALTKASPQKGPQDGQDRALDATDAISRNSGESPPIDSQPGLEVIEI